jgi:hypothetical protein
VSGNGWRDREMSGSFDNVEFVMLS